MARPDPVQAGIALEDLEGAALNMLLFSERLLAVTVIRNVVAPAMVAQHMPEASIDCVLQIARKISICDREILGQIENGMLKVGLQVANENDVARMEVPQAEGFDTTMVDLDVLTARVNQAETKVVHLERALRELAQKTGFSIVTFED